MTIEFKNSLPAHVTHTISTIVIADEVTTIPIHVFIGMRAGNKPAKLIELGVVFTDVVKGLFITFNVGYVVDAV